MQFPTPPEPETGHLNDGRIAHSRMYNLRLTGARFEAPEDVVRWLGAVRSQDYGPAKWSVAARTSNSRLVRDNIAEEITTLKEQPGRTSLSRGATIASALMPLGLIDEYRMFPHPVILGAGTPFFPGLNKPIALRLVETRTFGSGVLYLRHERADEVRIAARPR